MMARRQKTHRLGDPQLKILKFLWEKGEATVGVVMENLEGAADLAYTTICDHASQNGKSHTSFDAAESTGACKLLPVSKFACRAA